MINRRGILKSIVAGIAGLLGLRKPAEPYRLQYDFLFQPAVSFKNWPENEFASGTIKVVAIGVSQGAERVEFSNPVERFIERGDVIEYHWPGGSCTVRKPHADA